MPEQWYTVPSKDFWVWVIFNQFVVALVFAVFARPTRLLLVSYTE